MEHFETKPDLGPQSRVVELPYRGPFDFDSLLRFYRAHQVGRLEAFGPGWMSRVVESEGEIGRIVLSDDSERSTVKLETDFPDESKVAWIASRAREMLDLDADPEAIARGLKRDPKLGELWKKHPGVRLPSGWDAFEVAISTILGQLVSIERGRALVADLIELLGEGTDLEFNGRKIKRFPSPERIAASDLTQLKTTAARKRTLIDFSQALIRGKVSLHPSQDLEAFMAKAMAIRGIGPWTASYIALKALRHADAFPATDLVIAKALKIHPVEAVNRTRPWRGYVATLFWSEYSRHLREEGPAFWD